MGLKKLLGVPGRLPIRFLGVRTDQLCGQRALWNTLGIQHRQRIINPSVRWFGGLAGQANDVVLFFKTEKVERLVPDDRTAHAATVVLVAEGRSFRNCLRRREEWRRASVEFIPVEVVSRAV